MHIHLLVIHTSHFIVAGLKNAFINAQGSSLKHIRERLVRFIISEVINPRGEFCYS
jgi:hypothetical protein